MQSWSIRRKLTAAFGAMMLLMAVIGGVSLYKMSSLYDATVDMETNWLASVRRIGDAEAGINRHRFQVAQHVISTDDAIMRRIEGEIAETLRTSAQNWKLYEPLIASAAERSAYQEVQGREAAVRQAADAVMGFSRRNETQAAEAAMAGQLVPATAALEEALRRLMRINLDGAAEAGRVAAAAYDATKLAVSLLLAFGIVVASVLALLIIRGIRRDIQGVVEPMRAMAEGRLDVVIPTLPAGVEFAAVTTALGVFRDELSAKVESDRAAAAAMQERAERAERLAGLIARFDQAASASLQTVAGACTELDATARELSTTAAAGAEQATSLAASAEQANMSTQTVAASTEELSCSIAEVTRQIGNSAAIARRAAEDAQATNTTVGGLAEASQRIGDVVRLIGDIAGQTNLLALNATIEAARAGDAGKGFAVVASEVKALAAQTAQATTQISAQISEMQGATSQAVERIRGIASTIEELNQIATQVAAAAEEQAAATQEIGRAVAEAAQGVQRVSADTAGLSDGTQRTGTAAQELRRASSDLSEQSERISGLVQGFLADVRAA
jgi:methyl-accepting chemotaxis protein